MEAEAVFCGEFKKAAKLFEVVGERREDSKSDGIASAALGENIGVVSRNDPGVPEFDGIVVKREESEELASFEVKL